MSEETRSDEAGASRPVSWEVTAELLARYDRPGPRYTSYPTAMEFHEGVDGAAYEAKLTEANAAGDEPLSMYLHLPFCEHRCTFCGCNVIISPDKDRAAPYLDLVARELDMVAERLPDRRQLSQLHLGGGTPTYYSPEQLTSLVSKILAAFPPTAEAELAVEVDPRVTTDEHVDALSELGFNRISLGVQDFTPQVQEAIERVQSVEETAHLVEHARSRGFTGINIDLIYGLPYQEEDSFREAVNTVIDMGIDRAAVYSFAFVPWMHGNMKKLPDGALPDRERKFALFAIARERFLDSGYQPIGMDHFALPTDELSIARREGRLKRNFQGYCVVPAIDVIGLGISAIGDLNGIYVQNLKKLSRYQEAIEAGQLPVERGVLLNDDDHIRRAVIRQFMCNFSVEIPSIEKRFGIVFADYFAEDLELLTEHEREGLALVENGTIKATPAGELFIRNLAMCFDRYLREKHSDSSKPAFSRTV